MKTKKIPLRMCVGCRQMFDKRVLIRITLDKENNLTVDDTGKMNGRGFYFCKNEACIEKAKKNKGFAKQFGFSISDEIEKELKNKIN